MPNYTPSTINPLKCSNTKLTTISYTMTSADLPTGVSLSDFYNGSILGNQMYPDGVTVFEEKTFTIVNQLNPFRLPASAESNSWLVIAQQLANFQFDLSRLCNVSFTPNNVSNITSIVVTASINNNKSDNPNLPNDKLSSTCIGEWIKNWLTNFTQTNQGLPPLSNVTSNPICQNSTFTSNMIPEYFSNIPSIDFKKIKITDVNVSDNFEEFTDITTATALPFTPSFSQPTPFTPSFTPPTPRTPSIAPKQNNSKLSFDFIFAYTYFFAFVGAMFYGVASIVQFDPSTLIANKNISVFINAFIGVCGIIGLFNWFNGFEIPIVSPILFPNGQQIIKIQGGN